MTDWIPALQATALSLSLLWLLVALASRPRSPLAVAWAVFCGSGAMVVARGLVGPGAAGWYLLFGVGACLTCHAGDSAVMKRAVEDFDGALAKRSPKCVMPGDVR